jgi:uncharacterized protein YkwD
LWLGGGFSADDGDPMSRDPRRSGHGPTVLATCGAALVLSVVAGELSAAATTPAAAPLAATSTASASITPVNTSIVQSPGADSPRAQPEQVFAEFRAAHPPVRIAARKPAPAPAPTVRSEATQSGGSGTPSMAASVLSALNSERRAHGLAALTMNSDLLSSAHRHNLAMAVANTMSHQLPGEAVFSTRIANAGYRWNACAENIGWNSDMSTGGALDLEYAMYAEGPGGGHYQNIVGQYQDVGVDVWLDAVHHKLWLTEDFGAAA